MSYTPNTTTNFSSSGGPRRYESPMDAMSAALARNWWALALRGIFGILFGLTAVFLPAVTIGSLVLLFAAYMLVDGVFAIVAGVRAAARHERWGLLVFEGMVDLLAGVAALLVPGLTVLVMVTLLGIWAVISGFSRTLRADQGLYVKAKSRRDLDSRSWCSARVLCLAFLHPTRAPTGARASNDRAGHNRSHAASGRGGMSVLSDYLSTNP